MLMQDVCTEFPETPEHFTYWQPQVQDDLLQARVQFVVSINKQYVA